MGNEDTSSLYTLDKHQIQTFQHIQKIFLRGRQVRFESEKFVENVDDFGFPGIQLLSKPRNELDRLLAIAADRNPDGHRIHQLVNFGLGQCVIAGQDQKPENMLFCLFDYA